MLQISDDARQLILKRLESALEGRPDLRRGTSNIGLRLNFSQRGAYLSLAFPRPTDQVMSYMGRPLLIICDEDLSRLDSVCLTVQEGPGGNTLSIEPRTPEPASQPPL